MHERKITDGQREASGEDYKPEQYFHKGNKLKGKPNNKDENAHNH